MFPGLPEAGTSNLEETGDGVEEDGTATSVVKVEWIGKPTMAMEETSAKESLRGELGGTYHKAAAFAKPTSHGGIPNSAGTRVDPRKKPLSASVISRVVQYPTFILFSSLPRHD